MPGLIRGVARTAGAVVGTATAVSGRVARRQQGRWAQQDAQAQAQQAPQQQAYAPPPQPAYAQPVYAPPPPAAPTGTNDLLAQLTQLGQLKDSGVLTEAEFEAQKAKILAS